MALRQEWVSCCPVYDKIGARAVTDLTSTPAHSRIRPALRTGIGAGARQPSICYLPACITTCLRPLKVCLRRMQAQGRAGGLPVPQPGEPKDHR